MDLLLGDMVYFYALGRCLLVLVSQKRTTDLLEKKKRNIFKLLRKNAYGDGIVCIRFPSFQ